MNVAGSHRTAVRVNHSERFSEILLLIAINTTLLALDFFL